MALGTVIKVRNRTGSTINAGKVVYVNGFDDDTEEPASTINLANYQNENTMPAIGIVVEDIANGEIGIVRISGNVGGLNTANSNINDNVFVGSNGAIIFEDPLEDQENDFISQQIGVVAKSDTSDGQIILFPLEIRRKFKHTQLSDVFPDQHHDKLHAATHADGQEDELDHNSLSGRDSDGHPQYVLADGTRAFTGDVSMNGGLTMSSKTKALIPPKLTSAQRNALVAEAGMFIYNVDTNKLNFYDGTIWRAVTDSPA